MDDDKRVGELDERSLELLREIVREGAEDRQRCMEIDGPGRAV